MSRSVTTTILVLVPLLTGAQGHSVLVEGATIMPMADGGAVLHDHSIAFEGGTITWIGPRGEAPRDIDEVVDANGRFVLPGLIDAHVHLFDESQLDLFVANGVTTVLNMSGNQRVLEWRERVRRGTLAAPVIFTTGPQVKDDALPVVDTEVTYPDAAAVADFVRMHREQGFDFLKIWSSLPPFVYEGILAECREQGVRVTGHVPSRVGLRGVLASGQGSLAHVEEVLNKFFVRELDRSGFSAVRSILRDEEPPVGDGDLAVITTLITYEMIADTMNDERLHRRMSRPEYRYIDPALIDLWGSEQNDWWMLRRTERGQDGYYDRALPFMVELTGELHRAGVAILAGSDAGLVLANVLPGWSLHRELEILVEAGLSEMDALLSATARTGEFLEPGSGRGTLAVGAPADLLVLDRDPLASISNTRSISAVVLRGDCMDRDGLDGLLRGVEASKRVTGDFLSKWTEHGFDRAAARVLEARSAGEPVPDEASFLVAAYHRASAEELDVAVSLAELACRLYPSSYLSAYFLSGLHELGGRVPDARRELLRAHELAPDHPLIPGRLAGLAGQGAPPPGSPEEPPPGSPEEVIERVRAAELSGRYGDALRAIVPDQREIVVWAAWFGAAYEAIAASRDVVADYEAIVEEHDLDDAWLSADATGPDGLRRVAAEALDGKSLEDLFGDLTAFSVEHGRFGEAFAFLGELHGVDREADRATARIGAHEFPLVRVGDAWYWNYLKDLDD